MKEFFEARPISSKDSTVTLSTGEKWTHNKALVARQMTSVVEAYYAKGRKLSLRQLYYQLVSKEFIRNDDVAYKIISGILADLMYSGTVDWAAVEDRGRQPNLPYYETGPKEALESWAEFYKIDRQKGQKVAVELWTEKDAISGLLREACTKYGIPLIVNKGYGSGSAMYAAYNRVRAHIMQGRTVKILYLGDFDPSGLDMIRDITDRITFMLSHGRNAAQIARWDEKTDDTLFEVVPIGLTLEQIRRYRPLPNPAKITDPRAKGFIAKHGNTSYEVDAIDPDLLPVIVDEKIAENIDLEMYEARMKIEEEQRQQMRDVAEDFASGDNLSCPRCGADDDDVLLLDYDHNTNYYQCKKCGHEFEVVDEIDEE